MLASLVICFFLCDTRKFARLNISRLSFHVCMTLYERVTKWHALYAHILHFLSSSSFVYLLYFALFLSFIHRILIFSRIFFASRIYTLYLVLFYLFIYISPFFICNSMFIYKKKLESDY